MASQSPGAMTDESIGVAKVATVSPIGSRWTNGMWAASSRRSIWTSAPSGPWAMPMVPPV